MIAGGIISLKLYFSRPLLVGLVALALTPTWILSMGLSLALPLVLSTAFIAGMAVEIFGVLWSTALQKTIPAESYSRVISYEALGSNALAPIGIAVAGPLAEWIGISRTLYAAAALTLVAALIPLTLKSVRGLNNQGKG